MGEGLLDLARHPVVGVNHALSHGLVDLQRLSGDQSGDVPLLIQLGTNLENQTLMIYIVLIANRWLDIIPPTTSRCHKYSLERQIRIYPPSNSSGVIGKKYSELRKPGEASQNKNNTSGLNDFLSCVYYLRRAKKGFDRIIFKFSRSFFQLWKQFWSFLFGAFLKNVYFLSLFL